MMQPKVPRAPIAALVAAWSLPAPADSTAARCEIYAKGSDRVEKVVPCTFGQRQGSIAIAREDGVTHDLSPLGDAPGNFRDQHGNRVYRQSGPDSDGTIFRFPEQNVFVYWDTAPSEPTAAENATAPFATKSAGGEYDATTLLRCKAKGAAAFGSCPAGILRMENRQASIVIQRPGDSQFTVNFMTDHVNATKHEPKAKRDGDLWTVTLDNGEVYEVPLAAIECG